MRPQNKLHPCTLLVVDDVDDVRSALRISLEMSGYRVAEACNGREALEAIEDQAFDAVVTDMWMPEMTGAEFIEAARKNPDNADLVIIIVSGAESTDLSQLGADAALRKPVQIGPLVERLTTLNCRPAR